LDRTLSLKITTVEESDCGRLVEIGKKSAERIGDIVSFTLSDLAAMLSWTRLGPDGLWAVRDEGVTIGLIRYMRFLDAEVPHVLGLITVDPDFRKDDVGDWAYRQILDRAAQDGAVAVDAIVDGRDKEALGFLSRRQFERMVTLWTLEAAGDFAPAEAPRVPSGYRLRAYRPGEDTALLTAMYNRTFSDHLTFCAMTEAETQSIERTPYFDPTFTAILETDDGQAVGYSRCTLRGDARDGWIDILGILPEYQGKGLGRFLLLWSMHILAKGRARAIRLVVEGVNDRARALYDSEGFMEARTRLRYRRKLT